MKAYEYGRELGFPPGDAGVDFLDTLKVELAVVIVILLKGLVGDPGYDFVCHLNILLHEFLNLLLEMLRVRAFDDGFELLFLRVPDLFNFW